MLLNTSVQRKVRRSLGSCATLEDWLNPRRFRDDHDLTGFKGDGVTARAVKGHASGLDPPPEDKRALIAFLRAL